MRCIFLKKLLFVAGSLRIGGIERSLVNLLNELDYSKYEVDLFLYSNTGEYITDVPKEVRFINRSKFLHLLGLTMSEVKATRNIVLIFFRALLALLCKKIGNKTFWTIAFKLLPKLSGYDAAIAYSNNVSSNSLYSGYYQFIIQRVGAKRKIGWVHTDYRSLVDLQEKDQYFFEKLDKIVHVSQACKDDFDEIFPQFKSKTIVVYNIIPIQFIKKQSFSHIEADDQLLKRDIGTVGITVARLDKNKSVDRIIRIIEKLTNEGMRISWLIVGDGPERNKLEELAEQLGVRDKIIFLGMQKNPYSLIRIAKIFVLCSKFEGYPMVIGEAQAIATPVLVTKYRSAEEQIMNGVNGVIVENCEEALCNKLRTVITNDDILKRMKNHLITNGVTNDKALKQLSTVLP